MDVQNGDVCAGCSGFRKTGTVARQYVACPSSEHSLDGVGATSFASRLVHYLLTEAVHAKASLRGGHRAPHRLIVRTTAATTTTKIATPSSSDGFGCAP